MTNNWEQFQSTLLPPTAFERTAASDDLNNQALLIGTAANNNAAASNASWSGSFGGQGGDQLALLLAEIGQMKEEMRELRTENQSLRHKNREFIENARIYADATGNRQISIAALEELVRKQTCEIQALKTERDQQAARAQEVERAAAEHATSLQRRLAEVESTADGLRDRLRLLGDEKTALEAGRAEQEAETRRLREEIARHLRELETLRAFVNDSVPTIEGTRELRRQIESLGKENALLQTRFKAISEILAIQEGQLELKSPQTGFSGDRKRLGLLTKWRTKVFELLVQLKSQEISYRSERHHDEKSLEAARDRLDEERARNRILANVVEGKQAELAATADERDRLGLQVGELAAANERLERKSAQDLQSTLALRQHVEALAKQYQLMEASFMANSAKMAKFDKRLAFAANRISFVQSLYAGKKPEEIETKRAQQQPEPQTTATAGVQGGGGGINFNMTSNISSIHASLEPNGGEQLAGGHLLLLPSLELNDLRSLSAQSLPPPASVGAESSRHDADDVLSAELDKVREERDMLVEKLRSEREFVNEKLERLRDEYEQTLSALRSQLRERGEQNEALRARVKELGDELAVKARLYEELDARHDEAQRRLARLRQLEEGVDWEAKLREREAELGDKIAALDKRLNESRREQAKALIMMREMERTTGREKERLQELLRSNESYYANYVEKLKTKIAALEKERNILLAHSSTQRKSMAPAKLDLSSLAAEPHHQSGGEYTSFWVDSRTEEAEEESPVKLERSSGLTSGGAGEEKNEEILAQIRNIMGKLEMSGLMEEEEEDDENNEDEADETRESAQSDQRSLHSEFRKIIQRLNSDNDDQDDNEDDDYNEAATRRRRSDSLDPADSAFANTLSEHAIDDDLFRHSSS